jgi:hypothetical protein
MNSKKSYQLLEQAMKNLPNEHSFTPVRQFIRKALQEIATVEIKRTKKKESLSPSDKWNIDLQTGSLVNPWQTRMEHSVNPLKSIDEMIKLEQSKIEIIKTIPQSPTYKGIYLNR